LDVPDDRTKWLIVRVTDRTELCVEHDGKSTDDDRARPYHSDAGAGGGIEFVTEINEIRVNAGLPGAKPWRA